MRIGPLLMTLVLPGFGQAAAGRTVRGAVWAALCIAALVVGVWLPWSAIGSLVLRVGAALDAYACLRRTDKVSWQHGGAYAVACIGALPVVSLLLFHRMFRMPSSSMYPTIEIGDHIGAETLSSIERGDLITFTYPCDHRRDYLKRVVAVAGDTVEIRCSVVYVNGTAVPRTLIAGEDRYDDYDERADRWFPRPVSRYREQLGSHTYEVFSSIDQPSNDAKRASGAFPEGDSRDFPVKDAPPSCANADDGRDAAPDRGTLVTTAPENPARPCALHAHYVVPDRAVFTLGDNRDNSNDSRVYGAVDLALVSGRARWIWWSRHLSRIGRVE